MSAVSISGGYTQNPGGVGTPNASYNNFHTYQLYDDLFLTHGAHSLKFGFAWEHDGNHYTNSTQKGGAWDFRNHICFPPESAFYSLLSASR